MILKTDVPKAVRFPAEWERHKQTWIGWPERLDNWRDGAGPAQNTFVRVIQSISEFEPVNVLVSAKQWKRVRACFRSNERVRVIELSTDDCWLRDTGPLMIMARQRDTLCKVQGVDFAFNAWGGVTDGCYSKWDQDSVVAWKILDLERLKRYSSGLVLEGGAISCDGEGTLVTTEECLLNPNRNPGWTRTMIEEELNKYLGIDKVIWLPYGVFGDSDTNGHVDNLCVFADCGKVVLHWTEDQTDPQYKRSLEALKVLESSCDAKGRKLSVFKLVAPGPFYREEYEIRGLVFSDEAVVRRVGERLVASYVNFYFVNGAVIVPSFGEPWDSNADEVFKHVFPRRQIRRVAAREIILGGGGIHCITQQQPEERLTP
ncbi:agmatine deiminase [Galdieria sulphuraria]|uniref:Agmatine deiminase n=1 Tax=Galdieria sulphuraria TaxID=130081 RepID=M2XR79_GALSU|nr:agmatine deiminase [Galdieria sulphuraria]EME25929.1 agmatine deiminase [Galdieria sulphuraria]|eukprot:XP_005702449.1 agmatine deiminase [Galdieria sulphuraria]